MDNKDRKNLKLRYLTWLYKTTKEELDRIERKFTQLEVDNFILKQLNKLDKEKRAGQFIGEFETYISNKEKEGFELKYEDGLIKPGVLFLELKLKAVEIAIERQFDKKTLSRIKARYEKEMTERILRSPEHK